MSKSLKSSSSALLLAACFLVLFTNGGGRFAVSLMLKPIVEEFGWSRSDLSIAIAVFLVVSATTMFAAGKLVDRIGPRLVLGGGLVVSAIGIGAMSAISAPWHAIALYGVLYALGNGAASTPGHVAMPTPAPSFPPSVADASDDERPGRLH